MKLSVAIVCLVCHTVGSAERPVFSHQKAAHCSLPLAFAARRSVLRCRDHNDEITLGHTVLQRHAGTSLNLFPLKSRKRAQIPNIKNSDEDSASVHSKDLSRSKKVRQRVKELAKNIIARPIKRAASIPLGIATILKDAAIGASDAAVDEDLAEQTKSFGGEEATAVLMERSVDETFVPVQGSLRETKEAPGNAWISTEAQETLTKEMAPAVAIAVAEGAATAPTEGEESSIEQVMADIYPNRTDEDDVMTLTYDEVGYNECYMSPPFLDEEQCLIPGEAIVRVEKAPDNSRRIFAGIDIPVGIEDVWSVLTDYEHLQNVVPNLVTNDVLELYDAAPEIKVACDLSDEEQAKVMSRQMKGALLKQIGGAKVVGINFSARTTLEVREWPMGLPDFAHFEDDVWEGKSRDTRANDNTKVKLQRYRFPRPFALSSLPTRDISMQSIEDDDGEFRLYQGVWRMQPLPGCAPKGQEAMRLSYAVEVSPRAYLPVSVVEGRIVKDLCANLVAIRDYVTQDIAAEVVERRN